VINGVSTHSPSSSHRTGFLSTDTAQTQHARQPFQPPLNSDSAYQSTKRIARAQNATTTWTASDTMLLPAKKERHDAVRDCSYDIFTKKTADVFIPNLFNGNAAWIDFAMINSEPRKKYLTDARVTNPIERR
jgi:hypothetical protein